MFCSHSTLSAQYLLQSWNCSIASKLLSLYRMAFSISDLLSLIFQPSFNNFVMCVCTLHNIRITFHISKLFFSKAMTKLNEWQEKVTRENQVDMIMTKTVHVMNLKCAVKWTSFFATINGKHGALTWIRSKLMWMSIDWGVHLQRIDRNISVFGMM